MRNLPDGDGNFLIRTCFTSEQVWDDLCVRVEEDASDGLLGGLRLVNDPAYEGLSAEQLLNLVPDDSGCVYLAVADARTAAPVDRPHDRTLLIVNVDPGYEEHGGTFRAMVSDFASVDANLWLANVEFSEYMEATDQDGVYQVG
ncbi:DUF6924 domain-containing protein [Streptomyces sp. NPDC020681]|uniref:DUF6924 domain-containing protein n=1 Tax=Streptomyces sp. NPDC020681 TaxID=3365083 RepID=UPI00379D0806